MRCVLVRVLSLPDAPCPPQSAPGWGARRAGRCTSTGKEVTMKQQSVQALLAATLVAGAIGCETTLSGGAATPAIGRPECPSDEFAIAVVDTVHTPRGDVTHTRTLTTIPLAVPISNVPEFHDCQQLIQNENGYLALHAIFASFQLYLRAYSHYPR